MGNGASVDVKEGGALLDQDLDLPLRNEAVNKPLPTDLTVQKKISVENIIQSEKIIEQPTTRNIEATVESASNKPTVSVNNSKIQLSQSDIDRAKVFQPSPQQAILQPPIAMVEKALIAKEEVDEEEDDELDHLEPKDILFQFIPFYGQGDASTDSIVRATLTGLSVEEIDSRDEETGNTLLLLACQCRCEDLARIMINKGADCNAINTSGACCLHFSCYRDSASKTIAKLLLKNGSNPDVCERTYGCTPLHYCAGLGDIDFLKLLLSHGATIDLKDSYNYTCADYAREAGLAEVAVFLEDRIQKTKTSQHLKNHRANSSARGMNTSLGPPGASKNSYGSEWAGYLDPVSGATYFVSSKTSECLWEFDLKLRIEQEQALGGRSRTGSLSAASTSQLTVITEDVAAGDKSQDLGLQKKMSFMHSPTASMGKRIGGEENSQGPTIGLDSFAVQNLINETKAKLEAQFEEEKAVFRASLSEKDGALSKLQSEVEILRKDKISVEEDKEFYKDKYEKAEQRGGSALSSASAELEALLAENSSLKAEIVALKNQVSYEKEKLKSLEDTLSTVESSQGERIETEKKLAAERAEAQRERDEAHARALSDLEVRAANDKAALKIELERVNIDWASQMREVNDKFEVMKLAKDGEIKVLDRELADRKSEFAQEISAALLLAENNKRLAEESIKKAEASEEIQKALQNELIEAKMIQQFNIQLHKDLQREQNARRKLHNEMEDLKGKIRVYVRVRPFSKSEAERGCTEAVVKDGKLSVVVMGVGSADAKKVYDFDSVFGGKEGNTQTDVFRDSKHLIMSVIDGFNVCMFAYGQTGAGKSYTMIGGADIGDCVFPNGDFHEQAGITPRAVVELFRLLNERTAQITYTVEVQMFQLYRDNLEDLLSRTKGETKLKITLAEHSSSGLVQVDGAETVVAESAVEVMKIFAKGAGRRTTKETQMNTESSRSHLICSVVVKLTNRRTENQSIGKLTLVDLAGSERVDKSGAMGESLKEAQSINKSLSALGDVISALTTGQQHVPYRNHPLTMLMSDSIGGNAKTLMFVNSSPADYNNAESNNSLAFASRCKDITNSVAASGSGAQAAQMAALKKELAKLKKSSGGAKKSSGGLERPGSRGAV